MQDLSITVVICTRNRASSLSRTLDSLAACEPPTCGWDVVVVDNGSTDTTRGVVDAAARTVPIRYVYESQPGLSNARNCGIDHARGSYIIWTDDDVTFDAKWLSAYEAAFRSHADAAVFGGRIEAELEEPSPDWFVKNQETLSGLLVVRSFTREEPLTERLLPYGASFAIRADEQRRHKFDNALGVQPGRRRNGEETTLIRGLLGRGAIGYTVPAALAYHFTPTSRQTLRFVRDFFMAVGEEYESTDREPKPRFRMIKYYLSYATKRLSGREWLDRYTSYAYFRGILRMRSELKSRAKSI